MPSRRHNLDNGSYLSEPRPSGGRREPLPNGRGSVPFLPARWLIVFTEVTDQFQPMASDLEALLAELLD